MRFELFTIGGLNTRCQNGDKTGRRGWNKISDRNSREFKPKASRHTEQVEGRNHRFQHYEFVLNSDHLNILHGQKKKKKRKCSSLNHISNCQCMCRWYILSVYSEVFGFCTKLKICNKNKSVKKQRQDTHTLDFHDLFDWVTGNIDILWLWELAGFDIMRGISDLWSEMWILS